MLRCVKRCRWGGRPLNKNHKKGSFGRPCLVLADKINVAGWTKAQVYVLQISRIKWLGSSMYGISLT